MGARTEAVPIGACLVRAAGSDVGGGGVVLDGDRQSFGALLDRALALAAGLHGLGVSPGARVGILMPNAPEWIEAYYAVALLGAVSVPINVRYRSDELAYVLGHAGVSCLVTTARSPGPVDLAALAVAGVTAAARGEAAPATVVALGGPGAPGCVDDAAIRAGAAPVSDVAALTSAVGLGDVATLLYTSGTTAMPKGCLLSHEALVRTGIARFEERGVPGVRAVVWTPCPLFHTGALVPLLGCVALGATYVNMRQFEAGKALALIESERVTTALPLFPAFTDAMLDHPSFPTTDLSSLRQILTTGPPRGVVRAQEAFHPADLVSGYGMTELCAVAASSEPGEPAADRLVWDGRPFDGIEMKVVDPDDGADLEPGATGEIVARGYCLFAGYHDDPEATAAAFDVGGWFHTGDMGVAHVDGRIAYRGRFKDMLKVGGENVGALEVESFLGRHPAVRRVEVVGVPDARLQEVVGAFVELEPGATATGDELVAWCTGRIAGFKVPRHLWFVDADEWPMSATKVDKVALRARARGAIERSTPLTTGAP